MSATSIKQPEHEKTTYTYGIPKITIEFDSKGDAEDYLNAISAVKTKHPSLEVQYSDLRYKLSRVNS